MLDAGEPVLELELCGRSEGIQNTEYRRRNDSRGQDTDDEQWIGGRSRVRNWWLPIELAVRDAARCEGVLMG